MKRVGTKALSSRIAGFTLIEMMVSVIISMILLAGIYGVFLAQHQSYTTQFSIHDMQDQMRAGVYCPLSDIRMAGHGITQPVKVPAGVGWPGSQLKSLYPKDGGLNGGPDEVTVLFADYGEFIEGEGDAYSKLQFNFESSDPSTLDLYSNWLFEDAPGQLAIISDDIGTDIFQVSAFDDVDGVVTINTTGFNASPQIVNWGGTGPQYNGGGTTWVSKAKLVRYWVCLDPLVCPNANPPVLMLENFSGYPNTMDYEISRNVRDMQIQYFVDGGTGWVDAPTEAQIKDVMRVEIVIVSFTGAYEKDWKGSTTFAAHSLETGLDLNNTLTGLDPERRYRQINLSFRLRNRH